MSEYPEIAGIMADLGFSEVTKKAMLIFVANFSDVEASEIMRAEQELLKEGAPLEEVQKLCDVHSALFHGATREERIANAEKEVEVSLKREKETGNPHDEKMIRAAELVSISGHPLQTFTRENEKLAEIISSAKEISAAEGIISEALRDVSVHYAKKGDLLYPHLKEKYNITGPSDVMWTVDDEIRDELAALAKEDEHGDRDERGLREERDDLGDPPRGR